MGRAIEPKPRLHLLTSVTAIVWLLTGAAHAQETTGKQVIDSVLAHFPQKDFVAQARLTMATESGEDRTLDVQLQTRNSDGVIQSVIVVVGPSNYFGHAVLSVFQKDGTQATYRKTPASKQSKPVKGDALREPFAGTDFACEDFDFGFLRWPEHKLIDEKRRQARDCYVIESIPAAGQGTQYGRVVSWIDKQGLLLMMAEGYGPDGKLLKVFDVRSLKQFEGGWFIKQMNLKNAAANRATKLEVSQFEYAINLDDRFFSPETFGRVAAFMVKHGTKEF